MPTGKLTSFGLKAVDSDKWDGNIREAIAVAGKDGQKLVLLYTPSSPKPPSTIR